MYNIIIPENTSSNCYDSIIYSLLKYYNFDYEVYNLKYLYTDYYDNTIHDMRRGNYSSNIIKEFYDIEISFIDRNKSSNIFEIISCSLNNIPIGIVIDPYYCYWTPFYQKSHYTHMLLIVDINYNEKKYVCFDVHFNTIGYVKVDYEIIRNNFIRYFIIAFNEVKDIIFDLIIQNIHTLIYNFDTNLDCKKAELLNFFTQNDRDTLFLESIITSKILINLMWIAEDKNNVQFLFKYIEGNIGGYNFSSVCELLAKSKQKFVLLKLNLMRYAKSGVLNKDSLRNTIDQIFDTDVLMIKELKRILGGSI